MRIAATAVLLAGPTVLAFFAGGYFDDARLAGAIVAWALVLVVAVVVPDPFGGTRSARLTLLAFLLFAGWTVASTAWAPLSVPAVDEAQRLVLYAGAAIAGMALVRDRRALRAVEPALAAGVVVVVLYGISERLVPGLLEFERSRTSSGRLDQPLTYWNAMGALAAMGFVLCARIVGDSERPRAMVVAAGAGGVIAGLGTFLSLSRGALGALVAGLLVLLMLEPTRRQLRGVVLLAAISGAAVVCTAPLASVRTLSGPLAQREHQGAVMLVALVVFCAFAAYGARRLVARSARDPAEIVQRSTPRRRAVLAITLGLVLVSAPLVGAAAERSAAVGPTVQQGASRLGSADTNRYEYWRVALSEFAAHPLRGGGAGSFRVAWLRRRTIHERVNDAHSLYLQVAGELGLIGLGLLMAVWVGVGAAARRVRRAAPGAAEGLMAALVVYAIHAAFDWDWQMPALTLVAVVSAAALLGPRDGPFGTRRRRADSAVVRTAAREQPRSGDGRGDRAERPQVADGAYV